MFHGNLNFRHIFINRQKDIKIAGTTLSYLLLKNKLADVDILDDPVFIAPEIFQQYPASSKSDIYSFGVLLFVLFSEQWPYKYEINISAFKKNLLKPMNKFKKISKKIPDKLDSIIDRCLQTEPNNRFNSFKELINTYKYETYFQIDYSNESNILSSLKKERFNLRIFNSIKLASVAFIGIFIIGVLFYLYYLSVGYLTANDEIIVPDIINSPYQEAETQLSSLKLSPVIVGERHHMTIEKGNIIETQPAAGRTVKENRPIKLFISKGKGFIDVPDLIGRDFEKSVNYVQKFNLDLIIATESYSYEHPKGIIISQVPTANERVSATDNIQIILSKGFPYELTVEQSKGWFFEDKSNFKTVSFMVDIPDEWPAQDVEIIHYHKNKIDIVFAAEIRSGEQTSIQKELNKNSYIEIFFNDTLAEKVDI